MEEPLQLSDVPAGQFHDSWLDTDAPLRGIAPSREFIGPAATRKGPGLQETKACARGVASKKRLR